MSEEETTDRVLMLSVPKYRSMLIIGGEQGIQICREQDWPNAWHRFWQWFLLGFKWEQTDE